MGHHTSDVENRLKALASGLNTVSRLGPTGRNMRDATVAILDLAVQQPGAVVTVRGRAALGRVVETCLSLWERHQHPKIELLASTGRWACHAALAWIDPDPLRGPEVTLALDEAEARLRALHNFPHPAPSRFCAEHGCSAPGEWVAVDGRPWCDQHAPGGAVRTFTVPAGQAVAS